MMCGPPAPCISVSGLSWALRVTRGGWDSPGNHSKWGLICSGATKEPSEGTALVLWAGSAGICPETVGRSVGGVHLGEQTSQGHMDELHTKTASGTSEQNLCLLVLTRGQEGPLARTLYLRRPL